MTTPLTGPAPQPGPPSQTAGDEASPGIGQPVADDAREEDATLRDPLRRLSVRTLTIITVVLWLAALATLVIVLVLWHTPPTRPIRLG